MDAIELIKMAIWTDTMTHLLMFSIRCILRMIISIMTRTVMLFAVKKVYTFFTVFLFGRPFVKEHDFCYSF